MRPGDCGSFESGVSTGGLSRGFDGLSSGVDGLLALVAFCPDESVLVVCCLALKLSGEVLAMSVACEHCRA